MGPRTPWTRKRLISSSLIIFHRLHSRRRSSLTASPIQVTLFSRPSNNSQEFIDVITNRGGSLYHG